MTGSRNFYRTSFDNTKIVFHQLGYAWTLLFCLFISLRKLSMGNILERINERKLRYDQMWSTCNIVLLIDKFLSLVKQPTAKEIITTVMKKLEILSRNFSLFSWGTDLQNFSSTQERGTWIFHRNFDGHTSCFESKKERE